MSEFSELIILWILPWKYFLFVNKPRFFYAFRYDFGFWFYGCGILFITFTDDDLWEQGV